MSHNRQLVKKIHKFYKQRSKKFLLAIKKQIIWLLRTLFVPKRRRANVNAGFVLPTVIMVTLVVVLLTTAIMFRSFDRSKNASNVRVNEAVLNAAAPALERAKAKINKLFQDPRLPRSTPSDLSLYQLFYDHINDFTFGDETELKLVFDINGDGNITTDLSPLDKNETLTTAWKYPVDTNNDGKFDSYTLYGIYFRAPISDRPRSPLEARTPPMNENNKGSQCNPGATTSAQLVGSDGWFKRGGTLKKSIFVYTTTVPITVPVTDTTGQILNKYQTLTGNKGFAALEYQQDRERVPISNNAVLYNDDLQISPGGGLRLNGRVTTNANLLTGQSYSNSPVSFYQVSSPASCYYNAANSKIIVGGNVANGPVTKTSDINTDTRSGVTVDLYQGSSSPPDQSHYINTTNKTTTKFGSDVGYNNLAYEMRIKLLVDAGMSATTLPLEVTTAITNADASLDATAVKRAQLDIYFRKHTRRVPYAEIGFGQEIAKALKNTTTDYTTSNVLQGSGDSMRPPDKWMFPYDPNATTAQVPSSHSGYTELPIYTNSTDKIYLSATGTNSPESLDNATEKNIGDRLLVGNNLPEFWWNGNKFVSQQDGQDGGQQISGRVWDTAGDKVTSSSTRRRFPQVHQLDDLGITNRDDFWESSAAQNAQGTLDVVGGLRVITGAGIYLSKDDTPATTDFSTALTQVWSDSMAVVNSTNAAQVLPNIKTPFLQMRATAVYHYTQSSFNPKTPSTNPQTPIACVSSFYDPTNITTARNKAGLPDVSRLTDTTGTVDTTNPGYSNNGVVYDPPSKSKTDYSAVLTYQASLKYPNGQFVNERLKAALAKGSGNLTLSEKSALDSAICALELLDSNVTTKTPKNTVIPHGAIREIAFLDARQIKAIDKPDTNSTTTYNQDVELRQPLEIRSTVLDLDLLRKKSIGTGEFLFPNSGIIYATRDDALPDQSNLTSLLSATDFTLDPKRRPNGIMLINGSDISRNSTYKPEEKGLILATNLPVYIKGDFNRHSQQEFTNNLKDDWSNFYSLTGTQSRNVLNTDFACRSGQFTGCNNGETWRPATVIADAITILSSNFTEGFRNEGDYDLRDNVAPLGYDLNQLNGIETTAISPGLDERVIQLDLNGNGNMTDTNVITMNETTLGVDLNNNGNTTDTAVTIQESNIPSVVAHRLNGFWDNNFVTSFPWKGDDSGSSTGYFSGTSIKSSYFNNFVTPIQRRTSFPEYVMEICRKPAVSACQSSDWSVGYASGGSSVDWSYKATNSGTKSILTTFVNKLGAGTTARPALNTGDRRYPRRVAFLRDTSGNLILDSGSPVALGIRGGDSPSTTTDDDAGLVAYYAMRTSGTGTYPVYSSTNRPRLNQSTLWFKTNKNLTANYGSNYPLWIANSGLTNSRATDQPLLIPVLQIQYPFDTYNSNGDIVDVSCSNIKDGCSNNNFRNNNWLQKVSNADDLTQFQAETNLAFVQGDTPGRPSETNGGLENFVRYLERWSYRKSDGTDNSYTHKISGAFIQYKRSSFATAPWSTFNTSYGNISTGYSASTTNFGYPQAYRIAVNNDGNYGRTPFYIQPNRAWGFDVALLTQLPDLFSQRFTSPSAGDPNEFYREVGRDDAWVQTLLCAAQPSNYAGNFGTAPSTKYGTDFNGSNFNYAISNDQRPTSCRNAS